ncbi:hypothetical protein Acr_28g0005260 [Actinidia rufa]|uniref:Uncharacterized protein n=1 Tax=Actinidia rufa TaxID=165716 RepID=A0A7J0HA39_9ERIC|nr:hypothetical protein Acr_28g0005260 [Actinidia rufa]
MAVMSLMTLGSGWWILLLPWCCFEGVVALPSRVAAAALSIVITCCGSRVVELPSRVDAPDLARSFAVGLFVVAGLF